MKNRIIRVFLYFFVLINFKIQPAVIIWDVGETLIKADKGKIFWHFGALEISKYMLGYCIRNGVGITGFSEHMKDLFLSTLSKIPSPWQGITPNYETLGIDGKPMPTLQRDFLLGRVSSNQAIEIVEEWVKNNRKYFNSKAQIKLFKKSIKLYFEPANVKLQKYTPCMELLKKCYLAVDNQGNRINKCVILSNWAPDGVPELKKEFPDIFKYSDIQIFSGLEDEMKPSSRLFEKCKLLYPNEKEWFFIDDQKENLEAALNFGIYGAHPLSAGIMLQSNNII